MLLTDLIELTSAERFVVRGRGTVRSLIAPFPMPNLEGRTIKLDGEMVFVAGVERFVGDMGKPIRAGEAIALLVRTCH